MLTSAVNVAISIHSVINASVLIMGVINAAILIMSAINAAVLRSVINVTESITSVKKFYSTGPWCPKRSLRDLAHFVSLPVEEKALAE